MKESSAFSPKVIRMENVLSSAAAVAANKTLSEAFCDRHGCTAADFRRRFFWRTLHRHALPLAPLLRLGGYFAVDEDLIAGCGSARSMRDLQEEIQAHRHHPLNRGWLRRQLALRISTHRLRRLARSYLPGASLASPLVFRGRH